MKKQQFILLLSSVITLASTTTTHAWREVLPYPLQYLIASEKRYFENILKDAVAKNDPSSLSQKYNETHSYLFNDPLSNDEYPLLYALRNNAFHVAHALIEMGADLIVRRDAQGKTALHLCNDTEIAQILLEQGVDVNATNRFGRTPLHEAADKNWSKEVVELLLAHKADPCKEDQWGRKPLDLARNKEIRDVLKIAVAQKAPKRKNILRAPACSDKKEDAANKEEKDNPQPTSPTEQKEAHRSADNTVSPSEYAMLLYFYDSSSDPTLCLTQELQK